MRNCVVVLILLMASHSHAEEAAITDNTDYISAENIEHIGAVYNASGSVILKTKDSTTRAAFIRYDTANREVYAEGDVVYEDKGHVIKAEKALLDIGENTGVLYGADVFVKGDNYHIRGEEIRQTGEDRYFLPRASFTTCDGISPAWCFRGRDVDIHVGNRLKAKHATLSAKGAPVLYTPYLWAPILTDRKTGFLFPTLGYRNTTGYYLRLPFFLVLAENKDATFYLDYYSRLGTGQGAEYRYLYKKAKGSLNLYHTRNREIGEDFYEVRASHRQTAGIFDGFLDVNYVDRKDFYRIYEPYVEQGSRRFTSSAGEVAARYKKAKLYVEGRYHIDLKEGIEQEEVLQKLPEAGIYLGPTRVGYFIVSGRLSTAGFKRDAGVSGRRTDAVMKVSHSVGKGIALLQSFSAKRSSYSYKDESVTGPSESLDRAVYAYNANLKGRVHRKFGEGIEHAIEPSIQYKYAGVAKEAPPFFDVSELVPVETSSVEASLINRIFDKKTELVTLKVTETYDFLNMDKPYQPLLVDAFAGKVVSLRLSAAYDLYLEEVTSANSDAAVTLFGITASAGQSYVSGIGVVSNTYGLRYGGRRVSTGGRLLYEPKDEIAREVSGWFSYMHQCWGFSFSAVNKYPDDYGVFFTINLAGLGSNKPVYYGPGGFSSTAPVIQ